MSFEIRVNGQKFSLWESANLMRSIERNSGVFRFTSTNTRPADYPVEKHDRIEIVINGQTKLTGFVDSKQSNGSRNGQRITISGRDNTRDLIDSCVPDEAKTISTPTTLKKMCETVISALGLDIKVLDQSNVDLSFPEGTEINADSGKKAMDFLVEFARKKQVYLVADGEGNLVIYRPSSTAGTTAIIQSDDGVNNNVKSYSFDQDGSVEYNQYVVRSQDNFGSDPFADIDGGVDRKGEATDDLVPTTRYFEIQGEESMTNAQTKERANEEANIRRAQGFNYNVDLQGVQQDNGDLWDFGLITPVRDSITGVNGLYMIKDVTYSQDGNDGTVTSLNITRPEAYKVRGEANEQDRRIAPPYPKPKTVVETTPLRESETERPDSVVFNRNQGTFGKTRNGITSVVFTEDE